MALLFLEHAYLFKVVISIVPFSTPSSNGFKLLFDQFLHIIDLDFEIDTMVFKDGGKG